MEDFLRSVERKAYSIALITVHNREDALDLVQDSIYKFMAKYADKPPAEWKVLFYKILQNKIRDFYRKESIRSRMRIWLKGSEEKEGPEPLENLPDHRGQNPEQAMRNSEAMSQLTKELKKLPFQQRQVILLRAWEGLSIAEAAAAMGCSEGTVKSHYFRATGRLKEQLGEHWP